MQAHFAVCPLQPEPAFGTRSGDGLVLEPGCHYFPVHPAHGGRGRAGAPMYLLKDMHGTATQAFALESYQEYPTNFQAPPAARSEAAVACCGTTEVRACAGETVQQAYFKTIVAPKYLQLRFLRSIS